MKLFLIPHLICPACLPKECTLDLLAVRETAEDIVSGDLSCSRCKQRYPIRDGIANLLPNPDSGISGGQWRYEESGMVERYLWSHYSDLCGENNNGEANTIWAGCLASQAGFGLDAGCSVGRITFEMAKKNTWVVGCDLSLNFIRAARRLAQERQLKFSLPLEGKLRDTFQVDFPESWRTDNLEFIVADAMKLPFTRKMFQQTVSLNVLDRVSYPLAHLFEMNRVSSDHASFLLASPFSWTESSTSEEYWLGGKETGQYAGRGAANVRKILNGDGRIIEPTWGIERTGSVTWKMRSHCNHMELISSDYMVAVR